MNRRGVRGVNGRDGRGTPPDGPGVTSRNALVGPRGPVGSPSHLEWRRRIMHFAWNTGRGSSRTAGARVGGEAKEIARDGPGVTGRNALVGPRGPVGSPSHLEWRRRAGPTFPLATSTRALPSLIALHRTLYPSPSPR